MNTATEYTQNVFEGKPDERQAETNICEPN